MTTDNPASPQREIAPGVDIPRYTFGDPNVACQFVRYSDYAALASSADVWRERCEAMERERSEMQRAHVASMAAKHAAWQAALVRAEQSDERAAMYETRANRFESLNCRNVEEYGQRLVEATAAKEAAERALAAAQALPGKWRADAANWRSVGQMNDAKSYDECADELSDALGQRAAMGGEK